MAETAVDYSLHVSSLPIWNRWLMSPKDSRMTDRRYLWLLCRGSPGCTIDKLAWL